jgi:hypothetical protein
MRLWLSTERYIGRSQMFLTAEQVFSILEQAANTIVTITFIKRSTGDVRVLNGLLHVKKYVSGVGAPYKFEDYGLFTIYDLQIAAQLPAHQKAKAYRCFSYEGVLSITANGQTFTP